MSDTRTRTLDLTIPQDLPAELPVLALRHGVVLPSSVTPLTLGRPEALAAVDAANHRPLRP